MDTLESSDTQKGSVDEGLRAPKALFRISGRLPKEVVGKVSKITDLREKMHITIRSRKMISGSVDELMWKLDEGFMPIISKAPGYVAYYVVDSGDGVVSAVSIFADENTAEASNRQAEAWVRKNLGHMVPGPAEVISGPVMVPS